MVDDVLADIEQSPTPYHAAARVRDGLTALGFVTVDGEARLPEPDGGHGYVLERGGFVAAWWPRPGADRFVVVGAHTDSPNLRVRTHPDVGRAGVRQIGMEVYGGILPNTWFDRDLGLAGRVMVAPGDGRPGITSRLYREHQPIMRIPQLAIHLDRDIREKGLLVDPQKHLVPIWSLGEVEEGGLRRHVAEDLDVDPELILSWDLMAYDTQPPAVVGRDRDLIASARIDNLVSVFCGAHALASATGDPESATGVVPVLVAYDHEEVGSGSSTGAAGALLATLLERISASLGVDRVDHLAMLARSLVVSADGAHATHPNHVDRHEPAHHIALNGGVVIKRNANQRYATDAPGEAVVVSVARQAGIELQSYIHRNDLPCGSTIGPIAAARLGVTTVDIGVPQLAMHSARETAGVADVDRMVGLLDALWRIYGAA